MSRSSPSGSRGELPAAIPRSYLHGAVPAVLGRVRRQNRPPANSSHERTSSSTKSGLPMNSRSVATDHVVEADATADDAEARASGLCDPRLAHA
jgi:hypothetical protein